MREKFDSLHYTHFSISDKHLITIYTPAYKLLHRLLYLHFFCHATTAHLCMHVPLSEGHSSEDVRLTSTTNGRVEVFLSGVWVAVANSRGTWQLNSSQVVCRELGYSANGYSL